MKRSLSLLLSFCILIMVASCTDDDQVVINEVAFGDIITPQSNTSYVLNPLENQNNTALTISWEDAEYTVSTAIQYFVEFAVAGTNFENSIESGATSENFFTFSIADLNNFAVTAGLLPFTEGQLDIRVKSGIGTTTPLANQLSSSIITINVTPFTTELPKIAVPGNHQGWDPPTAPLMASSGFGQTDYEGYMWLDGGYKFLAPNDMGNFQWGATDWGDDGTFSGALVEDNETDCIATPAGYYYVQADTDALTYSANLQSWGIIGNATPTGWGSDTDMIYDPSTRTLRITMDLVQQDAPDNGLKFRVNDDWAINLGDNGADGTLEQDGTNIGVPVSGNYTIILDLSDPRNYTYQLILN